MNFLQVPSCTIPFSQSHVISDNSPEIFMERGENGVLYSSWYPQNNLTSIANKSKDFRTGNKEINSKMKFKEMHLSDEYYSGVDPFFEQSIGKALQFSNINNYRLRSLNRRFKEETDY